MEGFPVGADAYVVSVLRDAGASRTQAGEGGAEAGAEGGAARAGPAAGRGPARPPKDIRKRPVQLWAARILNVTSVTPDVASAARC